MIVLLISLGLRHLVEDGPHTGDFYPQGIQFQARGVDLLVLLAYEFGDIAGIQADDHVDQLGGCSCKGHP